MASPKTARAVLIVLVIVAVALLAVIAYPFAGALFIGAVLAGAFDPWQEGLARRLGGRRVAAAALVTLGVVLVLLLPLTWLAIFIGGELVAGVDYVRTTLQSEGVAGLVDDLPGPIAALVRRALERLPNRGHSCRSSRDGRPAARQPSWGASSGPPAACSCRRS